MITKEKYSFSAHLDRFGSDQACRDYLLKVRWKDGIPVCPRCGNTRMNYYLKSRNVYKCSDSVCHKQFTLISGTIFERTKLPLKTWFLAIYIFTTTKRGVSSCQLAKALGIGQKAAWFLLHRLREALDKENDILLNGIVEADETSISPNPSFDKRLKLARKIYNAEQDRIHGMSKSKKRRLRGLPAKRGRKKGSTKKVLSKKRRQKENIGERIPFETPIVIFGMIERQGRLIMKKLGNSPRCVTKENIFPHLIKHIAPTSTLMTDQLSLYGDAQYIFAQHHTINHNISYVRNGDIHTNSIENAWKHLKKMINGTYCHLSYIHFERYLNENTYRWNRRKESEKYLFEDFIPLLLGKKVSYKKLTTKEQNKLAA